MKTRILTPILCLTLALGVAAPLSAEPDSPPVLRFDDETTGLSILHAEVSLPTPGRWRLHPEATAGSHPLGETFLEPTPRTLELLQGRRPEVREEVEAIGRGNFPLRIYYVYLLDYVRPHEGARPSHVEELIEALGDDAPIEAIEALLDLEEGYHVLFDVAVNADSRRVPNADATVLAFETAPPVDDGQHWVLLSNGATLRRPIDPDLFARHGVEPVRGRKPWAERRGEQKPAAAYHVYARIYEERPVELELSNVHTGRTVRVRLDPAGAEPGERRLFERWASLRIAHLPGNPWRDGSPILPHWRRQASTLYEAGARVPFGEGPPPGMPWRDPGTDIFGVLGGRAAIRETLQLQAIRPDGPGRGRPEIAIADLPGVEVRSHPFEAMLDGREGGRLPLADLVPRDRLLVYFPDPEGLREVLGGGADFLFQAGAIATRRSLEYRLVERYAAALGMDRAWIDRFLASGAIAEIALALPDLFLIDGTELTAVMRVKDQGVAEAFLAELGLADLGGRTMRAGPGGEPSHWARSADLLVVSSDAGEMDAVLALHASGGEDSLGRSAELRYMLTKLPLTTTTRAFVYVSDPFIRRLVGPGVKIPQYRRLVARSEMEALVAGSLLHELDGHSWTADADTLIEKGYAPSPRVAVDAELDLPEGAVSRRFGSLPRLRTLLELDITEATAEEAGAYRSYLDAYERFWSRFFDPIAIRIDRPDPGRYTLSVFILPLLENSLYDAFRAALVNDVPDAPLQIPQIEPPPVMSLSLQLSRQMWGQAGDGGRGFLRDMGLDPAIWDQLRPDLHVAIADGDPILEMGSGDLKDLFGPAFDGQTVLIGAVVSMLTRPTALIVGLEDPEAVRRILDAAAGTDSAIMGTDVVRGSLYKVTDRDGWMYQIRALGLLKLRLGIEIQDRFLIIRNQPLTTSFRIVDTRPAALGGAAIELNPQACVRQLPALFASAAEYEREVAFDGIRHLHPLLMTVAPTVEEASQLHRAWFGFVPVHPRDGRWTWDGSRLTSSHYGSPTQPRQPDHREGDREFGLLRRIQNLQVSMQFEDDGLRTVVSWTLR